jgi:hypothetical protein
MHLNDRLGTGPVTGLLVRHHRTVPLPPPSRTDVEARFAALLSGTESRDFVDRWAGQFIASDAVIDDRAVWWALQVLHGIDLRHGPDAPYLHDQAQVTEWRQDFRERCKTG